MSLTLVLSGSVQKRNHIIRKKERQLYIKFFNRHNQLVLRSPICWNRLDPEWPPITLNLADCGGDSAVLTAEIWDLHREVKKPDEKFGQITIDCGKIKAGDTIDVQGKLEGKIKVEKMERGSPLPDAVTVIATADDIKSGVRKPDPFFEARLTQGNKLLYRSEVLKSTKKDAEWKPITLNLQTVPSFENVTLTLFDYETSGADKVGYAEGPLRDILLSPGGYTQLCERPGEPKQAVFSIKSVEPTDPDEQWLRDCKYCFPIKPSASKLKGFTADPFFTMSVNNRIVYQSEVMLKNNNPQWQVFPLKVPFPCNLDMPVSFQVWEWDKDGECDLMGSCELHFRELRLPNPTWPLQPPGSGWFKTGIADIDPGLPLEKPCETPSAILLKVDLQNLRGLGVFSGKKDPFVEIAVDDKVLARSKAQSELNGEAYSLRLTLASIPGRDATLPLAVRARDKNKDEIYGTVGDPVPNFWTLAGPNMLTRRLDHGQDSKGGTITIKEVEAVEAEVLPPPPPGLLVACQAKKLEKMDGPLGKADPFFIIRECKHNRILYKSEVIKGSLEPKWEPFQMSSADAGGFDNTFEVEVRDWDKDGTHDLIGTYKASMYDWSLGGSINKLTRDNTDKSRGIFEIANTDSILDASQIQVQTTKPLPLVFRCTFAGVNLEAMDMTLTGGKSDPYYKIMVASPEDPRQLITLYRSEVIKANKNPQWAECALDSKACGGWDAPIRIRVFDWDKDGDHDMIGETVTSLRELTLKWYETVLRRAENPDKSRGVLKLVSHEAQWHAHGYTPPPQGMIVQASADKLARQDGLVGKADPYLEVYAFPPSSGNLKAAMQGTGMAPVTATGGASSSSSTTNYEPAANEQTVPVVVYRSEMIKDTLSPTWQPFQLDLNMVGGLDRPLIFKVRDWDKASAHDVIGEFTTTLRELILGEFQYPLFKQGHDKSQGRLNLGGNGIPYPVPMGPPTVIEVNASCRQMESSLIDKTDCFVQIRAKPKWLRGKEITIYRTEVVMDNRNPQFKPFVLDSRLVGGVDVPLTIRAWDFDKDGTHDYIGEFTTTFRSLSLKWFEEPFSRPEKEFGGMFVISESTVLPASAIAPEPLGVHLSCSACKLKGGDTFSKADPFFEILCRPPLPRHTQQKKTSGRSHFEIPEHTTTIPTLPALLPPYLPPPHNMIPCDYPPYGKKPNAHVPMFVPVPGVPIASTDTKKKTVVTEEHPKARVLYRSEYYKDKTTPKWETLMLDVEDCGGLDNELTIRVMDYDDNGKHDLIGENTITLREWLFGPFLTSLGRPMIPGEWFGAFSMDSCGALPFKPEPHPPKALKVKIRAKDLPRSLTDKADAFFEIVGKPVGAPHFVTVYRSEWIKDDRSPDWAAFNINVDSVGGWDRPMQVRLMDYDKDGAHDELGSLDVTLREWRFGKYKQAILNELNESKGLFIIEESEATDPTQDWKLFPGFALKVSAAKLDYHSGGKNCFFDIRAASPQAEGKEIVVYRSEILEGKEPSWKDFQLSTALVGGVDNDITVVCWQLENDGDRREIGRVVTDLRDWAATKGSYTCAFQKDHDFGDKSRGRFSVDFIYPLTYDPNPSFAPAYTLQVKGKNFARMDVGGGKADPFMLVEIPSAYGNDTVVLYRTTFFKDNSNPEWPAFNVNLYDLNGPDGVMFISVFDYDKDGNHDKMGTIVTTLRELTFGPYVRSLRNGGKNLGLVLIDPPTPLPTSVYPCAPAYSLVVEGSKLPSMDTGSKSDAFIVVRTVPFAAKAAITLYRSEVVKDSKSPTFKPFVLGLSVLKNYSHPLQVQVWDWDKDGSHDLIGMCELTLREMGTNGQFAIGLQSTKGKGGLVFNCTPAQEEPPFVEPIAFTISPRGEKIVSKDLASKSDPFFEIHTKPNGMTKPVLVYRSEVIKNSKKPTWEDVSFNLVDIVGADQPLTITCYDWDDNGKHDWIGSCLTTLRDWTFDSEYSGGLGSKGGAFIVPKITPLNSYVAPKIPPSRAYDISVRCIKLASADLGSKSDPFIVIRSLKTGVLLHRSEFYKNNANPQFKPFTLFLHDLGTVDSEFSVRVYDFDDDGCHDLIGELHSTTLRDWAFGRGFYSRLSSGGSVGIEIKPSEQQWPPSPPEAFNVTISAERLENKDGLLGKSDPFLEVWTTVGPPVCLHRTNIVKDATKTTWEPFQVTLASVQHNVDTPIILRVVDYDKDGTHDLIGELRTSLRQCSFTNIKELIVNPNKQYMPGYRGSGVLIVDCQPTSVNVATLSPPMMVPSPPVWCIKMQCGKKLEGKNVLVEVWRKPLIKSELAEFFNWMTPLQRKSHVLLGRASGTGVLDCFVSNLCGGATPCTVRVFKWSKKSYWKLKGKFGAKLSEIVASQFPFGIIDTKGKGSKKDRCRGPLMVQGGQPCTDRPIHVTPSYAFELTPVGINLSGQVYCEVHHLHPKTGVKTLLNRSKCSNGEWESFHIKSSQIQDEVDSDLLITAWNWDGSTANLPKPILQATTTISQMLLLTSVNGIPSNIWDSKHGCCSIQCKPVPEDEYQKFEVAEAYRFEVSGIQLDAKDSGSGIINRKKASSDPFFELRRFVPAHKFAPLLYRSEQVSSTRDPVWRPMEIATESIRPDESLLIRAYDWDNDGSHDFIGESTTSLRELILVEKNESPAVITLHNPNKGGHSRSGTITFNSCSILEPNPIEPLPDITAIKVRVEGLKADKDDKPFVEIEALGGVVYDDKHKKTTPVYTHPPNTNVMNHYQPTVKPVPPFNKEQYGTVPPSWSLPTTGVSDLPDWALWVPADPLPPPPRIPRISGEPKTKVITVPKQDPYIVYRSVTTDAAEHGKKTVTVEWDYFNLRVTDMGGPDMPLKITIRSSKSNKDGSYPILGYAKSSLREWLVGVEFSCALKSASKEKNVGLLSIKKSVDQEIAEPAELPNQGNYFALSLDLEDAKLARQQRQQETDQRPIPVKVYHKGTLIANTTFGEAVHIPLHGTGGTIDGNLDWKIGQSTSNLSIREATFQPPIPPRLLSGGGRCPLIISELRPYFKNVLSYTFTITANKLIPRDGRLDKADPFMTVDVYKYNSDKRHCEWKTLHTTETHPQELNCTFSAFSVNVGDVDGWDATIRLCVWDADPDGHHDKIGYVDTTLRSLSLSHPKRISLSNPDVPQVSASFLSVKKVEESAEE